MKDSSFQELVNAYRTAMRASEPYQEDSSRKYTKVPTGVLEKLFEAVRKVLHEELDA